jgi:hypothetical protein
MRPRARGRKRLSVLASSAKARLTTRSSGSRLKLFSALAEADLTTLATGVAALCGKKRKSVSAS